MKSSKTTWRSPTSVYLLESHDVVLYCTAISRYIMWFELNLSSPSIWTATWLGPLHVCAYCAIPMPMVVRPSLSIWTEMMWKVIDRVGSALENTKWRNSKQEKETKTYISVVWRGFNPHINRFISWAWPLLCDVLSMSTLGPWWVRSVLILAALS